ncbi:DUF835 domain-containing protein [Thermococcus sp. MV11]|uniref:DUF835 domain-containing protein n=1 Tax=Thermococcus sp. MV11 TaxID=1638267 RepID=UPI001430DF57|nr:DUF835 domain-containing protein [Thermococcus sp. MV11]
MSGYLLVRIWLLHLRGESQKVEYSLELSVVFTLFTLAGIALTLGAFLGSIPPRAPEIVALAAFVTISLLAMRELFRGTPRILPMPGVGIGESSVFLVENEDEAEMVLKILHLKKVPLMVISRRPREEWISTFGFQPNVFLWLSNVRHPLAVSPSSLHVLREEAVRFMREHPGGAVYVEGIEYLMFYSDFRAIAKFLFTLRDYALAAGAYMIVMASPELLGSKRFAVLAREFKRPDFREIEDILSEKAFFGTVRREDLERLTGSEKSGEDDNAGGKGSKD